MGKEDDMAANSRKRKPQPKRPKESGELKDEELKGVSGGLTAATVAPKLPSAPTVESDASRSAALHSTDGSSSMSNFAGSVFKPADGGGGEDPDKP